MRYRRSLLFVIAALLFATVALIGCTSGGGSVKVDPANASISGKVTDEQGKGVAGVVVSNLDASHPTTTDAKGDYTMRGLKAGRYVPVFVSNSDQYFNGSYSDVDFDGNVNVAISQSVKHIDFELESGKAASISGEVHDKSGKAVADALVTLTSDLSSWTRTDAEGRYTLKGLTPEGKTALTVDGTQQGYVLATYPAKNYYDENAPGLSFGLDEHLTGVNVTLARGAQVSGVLKSTKGTTVEDLWVNADLPASSDSIDPPDNSGKAKADRNGKFEIKGLPDGAYTIEATDPENDLIAKKTITIKGGKDISGANLNLKADPTKNFSGAAPLKGSVKAKKGTQLSGLQVWAESGNDSEYADVNKAGEFRFKSLKPGSYKVSAGTYYGSDFAFADVTIPTNGATQHLDLTLKPGPELYGQITDTKKMPLFDIGVSVGTPLSGDMSYLDVAYATTTTLRDGRFRLRGFAPGKKLRVSVNAYEQTPWRYNVIIPKPGVVAVKMGQQVKNYNITLEPGGLVRGKATDLTGAAIAGLRISADEVVNSDPTASAEEQDQAAQDAGAGTAVTDKNGVYEITGLSSGNYTMRFSNGGTAQVGYIEPAEDPVVKVVAGGENTVLDFKLTKGGSLFGKLTGGFPIKDSEDSYTVELETDDENASAAGLISTDLSNETGVFSIVGIPDGTYRVHITGGSDSEWDGGSITIAGANTIKGYTFALK